MRNEINEIKIEQVVLSTIIFDTVILEDIQEYISYQDFYLEEHQKIFKIIVELKDENLPLDENFIRKKLNNDSKYDKVLLEIMMNTPVANPVFYAIEIKESSKKRQLISLSTQIKKYVFEESTSSEEILQFIQNKIENLEIHEDTKTSSSYEIIKTIKQDIENIKNNIAPQGQLSGLKELDDIIGTFEDGDLIVIAGRPSMGKTSLISTLVIQALEDGNGSLIETLEMPSKKIMARLLSAKSSEKLSNIKKGSIKNKKDFEAAVDFFITNDLVLHDKAYPTVTELRNRIISTLRKNPNIKNVFVDHTGKIKLDGNTREDIEIGHITNMLKKIARDFNIRVYLLQQLNRGVEYRKGKDKRPALVDLKNSGNIEEDADIVLGIYNESYYQMSKKTRLNNNAEYAEIIVLKNRDGEIGIANVMFEGQYTRFSNIKSKSSKKR